MGEVGGEESSLRPLVDGSRGWGSAGAMSSAEIGSDVVEGGLSPTTSCPVSAPDISPSPPVPATSLLRGMLASFSGTGASHPCSVAAVSCLWPLPPSSLQANLLFSSSMACSRSMASTSRESFRVV